MLQVRQQLADKGEDHVMFSLAVAEKERTPTRRCDNRRGGNWLMANPNASRSAEAPPVKGREFPRRNKPAPPANFVLPKPVKIPPPPNHRNSQ